MKKALFIIFFFYSAFSFTQEFNFLAQFEGNCGVVELADDYGYFMSGYHMHIIDLEDPENISIVNSHLHYNTVISDIKFYNDYLFLSTGKMVKIFDASQPTNPQLVSVLDDPNIWRIEDIFVQDTLLFINEGNYAQVGIFDISDLYNPTFQSKIEFNGVKDYVLNNNILYGTELIITDPCDSYNYYVKGYDISDPSEPELACELLLFDLLVEGTYPVDIAADNNTLVVAWKDSLKLYDITFNNEIIYKSKMDVYTNLSEVKMIGNTVYALLQEFGIYSIDVTDNQNPSYVGVANQTSMIKEFSVKDDLIMTTLSENWWTNSKGVEITYLNHLPGEMPLYTYNETNSVRSIEIHGNTAYLGTSSDGIQLVDISNPMSPVKMGNTDSLKFCERIDYHNDHIYCQLWDQDYSITIIDVSDPNDPQYIGRYESDYYIRDYYLDNDVLYITMFEAYLKIIDVSDPSNLSELYWHMEHGFQIAVKDSLMILTYQDHDLDEAYIKTLKINPDYSLTFCQEMILGDEDHGVKDIFIDYPYIKVGLSRKGAGVYKVDELFNISLCDTLLYSNLTYLYTTFSDDNYIYLYGNHAGDFYTSVINIEDPYNIEEDTCLDIYAKQFAKYGDYLYTAQSSLGYLIYGDILTRDHKIVAKESNPNFQVFPNPFNNHTTFKFNLPINQKAILSIYNISGKVIKQVDITNQNSINLSIEDYKNGVYIGEISTSNNVFRKKLIKVN